jgi:hypothetical protein
LAALLLCYPVSLHPGNLGPFCESTPAEYYAKENAWVLSWVGHQIIHDPLHLFDAPILHPLSHALAYTDHHIVPAVVALPILSITDDLALTYNLTWFTCLTATALGIYLLTVLWTGHRGAAVLAGLFFSFVPYRIGHGAFLQIQLLIFLPLGLACLYQYLRSGDRRWAWGLLGSFVLQCWCGSHLAIMAALALLSALLIWAPRSEWRRVASAAGILIAAALLAAPLAFPQLWVHDTETLPWLEDSSAYESATPLDYVTPSGRFTRFLSTNTERPWFPTPFPGVTVVVLGALGAVLLLFKKGSFARPRATGLLGVVLFLVGFVLSLGPPTSLGWIDGIFGLVGWPIRFSLLALLSLSIFASFGAAWLLTRLDRSDHQTWVAVAIGAFFVLESFTLPTDLASFRDEPSKFYTWLKENGGDSIILELPYIDDGSYLFSARHHGFLRTLNPVQSKWIDGFASTLPLENFPDSASLARLQDLGVRYAILHLEYFEEQRLLELLNDLSRNPNRLLPVRDFGQVLVFEVVPIKNSRTRELENSE